MPSVTTKHSFLSRLWSNWLTLLGAITVMLALLATLAVAVLGRAASHGLAALLRHLVSRPHAAAVGGLCALAACRGGLRRLPRRTGGRRRDAREVERAQSARRHDPRQLSPSRPRPVAAAHRR